MSIDATLKSMDGKMIHDVKNADNYNDDDVDLTAIDLNGLIPFKMFEVLLMGDTRIAT